MGQTPDEMLSAVAASLQARTGRSLPAWIALVRASGVDPLDQRAVRGWLRSEHGIPQNSQWAIADAAARAAGWVRPAVAEYVDGQYAGQKAALRPIYDALAAAITDLGEDVTIEGRSTYIPFVRRRQFAAIAAAPETGQISGCGSPTRRWPCPALSTIMIDQAAPAKSEEPRTRAPLPGPGRGAGRQPARGLVFIARL